MANIEDLHVGDSITINAGALNVSLNDAYNGKTYSSDVYSTVYKIWSIGNPQLGPEYLSFGLDGESSPTGGQWAENVTLVGSDVAQETVTEDVPVEDETQVEDLPDETAEEGGAIDSELESIMSAKWPNDIYRYNMRLFGIPHQFTNYTDYRTFYSKDRPPETTIGRKFLESIVMEAPVLTVIPGKPKYLPNSKNTLGLTEGFMQAANNDLAGLFIAMNDEDKHAEVRYYDFQQDYLNYKKYANVLCQVAASYLELGSTYMQCGDEEKALTEYRWENYRWNDDSYANALGKAAKVAGDSIVEGIKSVGSGIVETLTGTKLDNKISIYEGVKIDAFDNFEETDEDFLESMESLLRSTNFVQFYVDAATGISESMENEATQSKLAQIYDAGESFLKEAAFIANSGGINAEDYQNMISGAGDAINQATFDKFKSTDAGGFLNRLLSSVTNVIRGQNMIFPDIYQRSRYTKNYSFTIDLRSPYGNKTSYFLNVLVPLLHLICLVLPKQETANSYGAPFLVKCFYPGICSCNLGLVTSLTIDKNPSGESWTIDGYPSEIRVTMNVADLYSELTMVPAGIDGLRLFVSNSSLIEYLAVQCGLDLISPQIKTKSNMYLVLAVSAIQQNLDSFGVLEGQAVDDALKDIVYML